MRPSRASLFLLVLVACSGSSSGTPSPQPSHGGFLLGSPVGMTTKMDPTIRLTCAGFDSICSTGEPLPSPKFDMFFLPWLAGTGWTPGVDEAPILAMSLGIDTITVTEMDLAGEPVAVSTVGGTLGWIAFQFTVNSAELEVGDDLAPDVLSAKLAGELDGTVFSFVVPGSDVELIAPEGQSVRAKGPGDLGLAAGDEIHALNMHMAMYRTDLGQHASFFTTRVLPLCAPECPTIYFTLRPEFVAAWGSAISSVFGSTPDASTIYKSTWNGSWGMPDVHRDTGELGILADQPHAIDGLAVDSAHDGNDEEIMYSLAAPTDEDHQIVYVRFSEPHPASAPAEVRRVVVDEPPDYPSLGGRLQAGRGIGDFCTKDPFAGQGGPDDRVLDDYFVARRLKAEAPAGATIALAVSGYRQKVDGGQILMRTCMSMPNGTVTSGTAFVRWGTMASYYMPGPITWLSDSIPFLYNGKPLTADYEIPQPYFGVYPALVAQWSLVDDHSCYYYAPLSSLRY